MLDLFAQISPAWALIAAGTLCAVIPSHFVRKILMVAAPVAAFALLQFPGQMPHIGGVIDVAGVEIATYRLDRLSYPFGLIFILAAFLMAVFAWHERDRVQDASALLYSGSALGAVFSGDLLSLFVFWELTAIASVFLIWQRRTAASRNAGLRYL